MNDTGAHTYIHTLSGIKRLQKYTHTSEDLDRRRPP